MNRRYLSLLATLLCVFGCTVFALPSSASNQGSTKVRFSTALIAPYQTLDEHGTLSGLAIPIIKCAMRSSNYGYSIDILPWARAQKNVELGVHDAFFVASKNASRDSYATASMPIFSGRRSWHFKNGFDADPENKAFKENNMVGTVFGTNMHTWLERDYKNVITKDNEKSLIELLQSGRLDALLLTDEMYAHAMSEKGLDANMFKSRISSTRPLSVHFGHKFLAKEPAFLEQFNNALPECLAQK